MLIPPGLILGEEETEGRAADLVMLTAVAETLALESTAVLLWTLLAAANIAVLASWKVDTVGRSSPGFDVSFLNCCDNILLGLLTVSPPPSEGMGLPTPLERAPAAALGATLVTVLETLPVGVLTVLILTLSGRDGDEVAPAALADVASKDDEPTPGFSLSMFSPSTASVFSPSIPLTSSGQLS